MALAACRFRNKQSKGGKKAKKDTVSDTPVDPGASAAAASNGFREDSSGATAASEQPVATAESHISELSGSFPHANGAQEALGLEFSLPPVSWGGGAGPDAQSTAWSSTLSVPAVPVPAPYVEGAHVETPPIAAALSTSAKPEADMTSSTLKFLAERDARMRVVLAAAIELEHAAAAIAPGRGGAHGGDADSDALLRSAHDLVLRLEAAGVEPAARGEEGSCPLAADALATLRAAAAEREARAAKPPRAPPGVGGGEGGGEGVIRGPDSSPGGASGAAGDAPGAGGAGQSEPFALDYGALVGGLFESPFAGGGRGEGNVDHLSASELRAADGAGAGHASGAEWAPRVGAAHGGYSNGGREALEELAWENSALQRRAEAQASALIEVRRCFLPAPPTPDLLAPRGVLSAGTRGAGGGAGLARV